MDGISLLGEANMNKIISILLGYGEILLALVIAFLVGYTIGYIISKAFSRILLVDNLQKTLVRFGAVTTKLWGSIVNLIEHYVIWWVVFFSVSSVLVSMYNITVMKELVDFLSNIGWFIALTVIGLLLGGALYKIIKDALEAIGLEAELEKHKISDSLGGISLSTILAGIVKWFIILLFLGQGVKKVGLFDLGNWMDRLLNYIPRAILGILVILASLILATFIAKRIKFRGVAFADLLAVSTEVIIIFFGIVLALPHFGVTNVAILEYSFLLLIAGVSIGLAIALGLGLKDSVARASEKIVR